MRIQIILQNYIEKKYRINSHIDKYLHTVELMQINVATNTPFYKKII